MGLAAAAGLDTKRVFEELRQGEGASWMFGNRVPFMLEPGLGRYSAVTIIAKDVGIVAGTARAETFPLPMVAVAEQLFLSAIGAGWGAEDDCVVVRLYLPGRPRLVTERAGKASEGSLDPTSTINVDDITDLMVGVHLAAMSEAMAFCETLGVDSALMYDIVSNAAGASNVFGKYFGRMRERGWGLKGLEGVRERLVSATFFRYCWNVFLREEALTTMMRTDERGSQSRRAEIPALSLLRRLAGV